MNADELLGSVDEFLGKLRDKVNLSEAKLDIAMENIEKAISQNLIEVLNKVNSKKKNKTKSQRYIETS